MTKIRDFSWRFKSCVGICDYTIANITRESKYIDSLIDDSIFRELRSFESFFPELSRL
ncbi:hypothetical protein KKB18_04315 [bacterium]|nr:hypothetical protein [bacterium]